MITFLLSFHVVATQSLALQSFFVFHLLFRSSKSQSSTNVSLIQLFNTLLVSQLVILRLLTKDKICIFLSG